MSTLPFIRPAASPLWWILSSQTARSAAGVLSGLGLAAALALAGCCPDGASADGGLGDGSLVISPRLSVLQEELLDQHCVTDCHEGVNAASNLRLERDRSYLELVNRASQQLSGRQRVIPGNPDDSYLIQKMEGSEGTVGVRMPRLAPPRPQAETDALRAWISSGAAND